MTDKITDEMVEVAYGAWESEPQYASIAVEKALAAAYPLIRAQVLEEAAKVCDARYMGDNNREDMEARRCAQAIRDLKEKRDDR
jgi:hypothetical protein